MYIANINRSFWQLGWTINNGGKKNNLSVSVLTFGHFSNLCFGFHNKHYVVLGPRYLFALLSDLLPKALKLLLLIMAYGDSHSGCIKGLVGQ